MTTRKCSKCGTKFTEKMKQSVFEVTEYDYPPECFRGGKYNGVCVDCCGCYRI